MPKTEAASTSFALPEAPASSSAPLSAVRFSSGEPPPPRMDTASALRTPTDWKDALAALCAAGSILMLAAQLVGELPGTEPWHSVVGIVLPLALIVARRLRGHAPRPVDTSPRALAPRIASAVAIVFGLWSLWTSLTSASVGAGVVGVAALAIGAAIDRRLRAPREEDA